MKLQRTFFRPAILMVALGCMGNVKRESGERRIDAVELADFCRLYGVKLSAFLKRAGLE
jgi:hypothetical protein